MMRFAPASGWGSEGKVISAYLGHELAKKLEKPLVVQGPTVGMNAQQQSTY